MKLIYYHTEFVIEMKQAVKNDYQITSSLRVKGIVAFLLLVLTVWGISSTGTQIYPISYGYHLNDKRSSFNTLW